MLIKSDFIEFLARSNADLGDEEREQIFESFRLVGGDSAFATLHKVYNLLINGMPFSPQNEPKKQISLIDFENPRNNTFRVLNQFVIEYTNNGQKQKRVPDIVLFVNGVPLCIIELKNPQILMQTFIARGNKSMCDIGAI